jgi:hypothetical protein
MGRFRTEGRWVMTADKWISEYPSVALEAAEDMVICCDMLGDKDAAEGMRKVVYELQERAALAAVQRMVEVLDNKELKEIVSELEQTVALAPKAPIEPA